MEGEITLMRLTKSRLNIYTKLWPFLVNSCLLLSLSLATFKVSNGGVNVVMNLQRKLHGLTELSDKKVTEFI